MPAKKKTSKTDAKRVDYSQNWKACEKCGRKIARMEQHMKDHRSGKIDAKGFRTDKWGDRAHVVNGPKAKPKAKKANPLKRAVKKASKPRAKKAPAAAPTEATAAA